MPFTISPIKDIYMNKTLMVVASVSVVLLAAVAFMLSGSDTEQESKMASVLFERDYSPNTGFKDAKVTIVEFFDPACGTCRAFHPFVKKLMAANPEKIRLVMRYTPFHEGSDEVVKMLEAAKQQGRYWPALEELYAAHSLWIQNHVAQPTQAWKILGHTDLDLALARKSANSVKVAQRIEQDMADAKALQVTKTPSFFVNGKPLTQFGYKQLQALIENELRIQYPE
jgi:protein-disulfide isomerase